MPWSLSSWSTSRPGIIPLIKVKDRKNRMSRGKCELHGIPLLIFCICPHKSPHEINLRLYLADNIVTIWVRFPSPALNRCASVFCPGRFFYARYTQKRPGSGRILLYSYHRMPSSTALTVVSSFSERSAAAVLRTIRSRQDTRSGEKCSSPSKSKEKRVSGSTLSRSASFMAT